MLTNEIYEKHEELVNTARANGYGYADRLTMLMDLELCDEAFQLDLDEMVGEWYSALEYFWSALPQYINRETKTFGGWIPEFATVIPYSKYEEEAKRLIEEDYFSIPQVVGFIYALFQDYQIHEPEELYLYKIVDPEEKYNEPTEYWNAWNYENPLAENVK